MTFDAVRDLVLAYGWNATSYQILNPGFTYWFTADRRAVVAYVARHGVRVVAGVPVCAVAETAAVVDAFEADAARLGEHVAWFCVEERALSTWIPRRPQAAAHIIGAQPVWNPASLASTLRARQSLRAQLHRASNKGVVVTEWTPARATGAPALRACLEQWLDQRGLPALHFLVEPDTLDRLADRRVFVAERAGAVVGFLVASPIPTRRGWLVEQVVRGDGAPNGTAELLLMAAAERMAAVGDDLVTLGLSPLSVHGRSDTAGGRRPDRSSRAIRAALAWLRVHGRRFYNFEGLDAFKAKFQPDAWEPVYAVLPDRRHTLRSMIAIGAAFGGASAVTFAARVAAHALRFELRRGRGLK